MEVLRLSPNVLQPQFATVPSSFKLQERVNPVPRPGECISENVWSVNRGFCVPYTNEDLDVLPNAQNQPPHAAGWPSSSSHTHTRGFLVFPLCFPLLTVQHSPAGRRRYGGIDFHARKGDDHWCTCFVTTLARRILVSSSRPRSLTITLTITAEGCS